MACIRGPTVAGTKYGCRQLGSAFHSGRLLHEVDVNRDTTEKCRRKSCDKLKNRLILDLFQQPFPSFAFHGELCQTPIQFNSPEVRLCA
jgi:hypothetical protein